MLVFKDVKAYSQRLESEAEVRLEDKMDLEFLSQVMQTHAFFISCLVIVLQNDQDAHKL